MYLQDHDSLQVNSVLFMRGCRSRHYGNRNTANMMLSTVAAFLACRTAIVCLVPLQCTLLITCRHVAMSNAALQHSTIHSGFNTSCHQRYTQGHNSALIKVGPAPSGGTNVKSHHSLHLSVKAFTKVNAEACAS